MLRFVADENFNSDILQALLQRKPDLDIVRVQDEVPGMSDPELLAWAATRRRILLTHDMRTIPKYVKERDLAGLSMPGVIEVKNIKPIGPLVEDLLILFEATRDDEWEGQVKFVPIR